MKAKVAIGLLLAALTLVFLASAVWAEKIICISREELRGEETVKACLAQGDKFALVDEYGAVRILSKEEIELMGKLNPKIYELPAFSLKYEPEAPPLPKLPHHAVPKKYQ
jgi:hypothetical protein